MKLFLIKSTWNGEKNRFNMDKLSILNNESNFKISNIQLNSGKSFKDIDIMEHYKVLQENSIEIRIHNISLIVSTIDNPQVRTAFRLNNGHLIKKSSGALINTLFNKDMKLKRITDTKTLSRKIDRKPIRTVVEIYVNTLNQQQTKEIPIF